MLILPTKGLAYSVNSHNIHQDILCDWIEASVILKENELSTSDVVDSLMENNIYIDQDFAREMVSNAWFELEKRFKWIGNHCIFTISGEIIKKSTELANYPAELFCLLLSIATTYDWWAREFGHDYTEQGELFELVTKASLEAQFSDWKIVQTGWCRTNTNQLRDVVTEVANCLGEELGGFDLWDEINAKERGLDLLCYRPFPDYRLGIPVYLMQCASGGNWEEKLKSPDIDVWNDMIRFRNKPLRAFSVPFSFMDDEFLRNCVRVKGLVLDRCRLLRANEKGSNWLSDEVVARINSWAEQRINVLLSKSM